MELLKDIMVLIRRFFKGTPANEVNVNNFYTTKMEINYLRYQLANEVKKNKALELKIKYQSLKTT